MVNIKNKTTTETKPINAATIDISVRPSVSLAISLCCYCCCWRIKELNVWPTDVRLLTILIPPLFTDAAAFYIPYERTDGRTNRQTDGRITLLCNGYDMVRR